MFEIVSKAVLAPNVKEFRVRAPRIARKAQPGQYLIVVLTETSERIPLTIADCDGEEGTVTLVVQEVGKSTYQIGAMEKGDGFLNIAGPLGKPSEIEGIQRAVCVGGGIGVAPVYPIARAMHAAGAHVTSIIGARSRDLLIWEDRMRSVSNELIVTTDDGSYGRKGLVTEPLKELLEERAAAIDLVLTIGPAIMMKFVAETTRPYGVKTVASLNTIMVDGTGMCGGCRCQVAGVTQFACVDGPEFDAHQVDFDLLLSRQKIYREQEQQALERYLQVIEKGRHDR